VNTLFLLKANAGQNPKHGGCNVFKKARWKTFFFQQALQSDYVMF